MNLFTQTVDASLWTSRAFDDASHDASALPARPAPSVTFLTGSAPPSVSTLILLSSPASTALLAAHYPPTASPQSIGDIDGAPILALPSLSSSPVLAVTSSTTSVVDEFAVAWASALYKALRPSRVVVLATIPLYSFGEEPQTGVNPVLAVLGATPVPSVPCAPMVGPALLDGAAAALICEAEMAFAGSACAYVDRVEATGFDGSCLARLGLALDAEAGKECAAVGEEQLKARRERYAKQVHKSFFASSSHSLYM
jgi:hypothetical protein